MKAIKLLAISLILITINATAQPTVKPLGNGITQYEQTYTNGGIKARYYFDSNNQRTGVWQIYNQDGELEYEMEYRNNLPDGIYKKYYNGTCYAVAQYKNGQLDGEIEWRRWDVPSFVTFKGQYTKGKRNGKWTYIRYNTNETVIGYYKNDSRDSLWIKYNAEGNKLLEIKFNTLTNIVTGEFAEYFPNGQLKEKGMIKNGYLFSKHLVFDENGRTLKDEYLDEGKVKTKHAGEINKIITECEPSRLRQNYKIETAE